MKKCSSVFLALFAFVLFCAVSLSAETAPKKTLAIKDIDNFAANFEAINTELDALGDKYNDVFAADESATPAQTLTHLRSVKVPSEIQGILKKNGLGDNGFEKLMVITIGFSALEMESYMNDQIAQAGGSSPEMQPYIDQGMAQVKDLKSAIHPDDLGLLSSKRDLLYPLLMSTQNDDETGYSDEQDSYGEEPYEVDEDYSDPDSYGDGDYTDAELGGD